jgi:pimeloyl-ACP methyl ester carboxylesterase
VAIAHTRPFVLLGHSFGGMVANQYAAARPERVRALIMEDIDVARDDHDDFISPWAGVFPTREALEARIGARLAPYLRKSMKEVDGGWTLTFQPREVLASSQALNGDYWHVWLSHTCPALVIRGEHSTPVDGKVLAEMARRRPGTDLVTIDAGHSVHIDRPDAFVAAVRGFLDRLP